MSDVTAEGKFLNNTIANIVFSALALLSFYAKLCLMAAEAIGGLEFLLIFACEAVFCVFSAIYACFMLKRLPTSFSRLSLLAGAWSVLLFSKDMVVFYVGKSFVESRGLLFAISSVLFAALFALMLLSICKSIYGCSGLFLFAERKNLVSFFRRFFWCMVGFISLSNAFLVWVNSRVGRSGNGVIVPKEVTEKWEPRLLAIALFLFFPFFATSFVQIGQDIAEEQKQKEEQ